MKVLIIEDEPASALSLKNIVARLRPDVEFLPQCSSVKESVYVLNRERPDLIFMDIELSDGISFDIFRTTPVFAPVVFTTAFDQYVLKAFDFNSIAYILKPLDSALVEKALFKWERNVYTNPLAQAPPPLHTLGNLVQAARYKSQFLVKQGQKLIPVKTSEVNHFVGEDDLVFLVSADRRKYLVDKSLSELEGLLDPNCFFRVNRKFLISRDAIVSLEYYTKGQVLVKSRLLETEKLVASRQQTARLKEWLNQ